MAFTNQRRGKNRTTGIEADRYVARVFVLAAAAQRTLVGGSWDPPFVVARHKGVGRRGKSHVDQNNDRPVGMRNTPHLRIRQKSKREGGWRAGKQVREARERERGFWWQGDGQHIDANPAGLGYIRVYD